MFKSIEKGHAAGKWGGLKKLFYRMGLTLSTKAKTRRQSKSHVWYFYIVWLAPTSGFLQFFVNLDACFHSTKSENGIGY